MISAFGIVHKAAGFTSTEGFKRVKRESYQNARSTPGYAGTAVRRGAGGATAGGLLGAAAGAAFHHPGAGAAIGGLYGGTLGVGSANKQAMRIGTTKAVKSGLQRGDIRQVAPGEKVSPFRHVIKKPQQ